MATFGMVANGKPAACGHWQASSRILKTGHTGFKKSAATSGEIAEYPDSSGSSGGM